MQETDFVVFSTLKLQFNKDVVEIASADHCPSNQTKHQPSELRFPFIYIFFSTKKRIKTAKQQKDNREGSRLDMKSRFNVSFDAGVEASKGIVTVGIEIALLVDIVLVEFLAYLINSENNVDHAHLSLRLFGGKGLENEPGNF